MPRGISSEHDVLMVIWLKYFELSELALLIKRLSEGTIYEIDFGKNFQGEIILFDCQHVKDQPFQAQVSMT